MTLDTAMFVGKFVEEARDRVKALGAALLRLEQTPGAAVCPGHDLEAFRALKSVY